MSSTQDVAREKAGDLPVLVVAAGQTQGRGRSGTEWRTADRALAVSLAFRHDDSDDRPFSLMAGVAAVRATTQTGSQTFLKWPNDVMRDGVKVGGILVERSRGLTVIGLGLNLWWPSAPDRIGALFGRDPGDAAHAEIGALWGAELVELIDAAGWPLESYLDACDTIGREITWEPDGAGRAVGVAEDGGLIVENDGGERVTLHSGAVLHVRSDPG